MAFNKIMGCWKQSNPGRLLRRRGTFAVFSDLRIIIISLFKDLKTFSHIFKALLLKKCLIKVISRISRQVYNFERGNPNTINFIYFKLAGSFRGRERRFASCCSHGSTTGVQGRTVPPNTSCLAQFIKCTAEIRSTWKKGTHFNVCTKNLFTNLPSSVLFRSLQTTTPLSTHFIREIFTATLLDG